MKDEPRNRSVWERMKMAFRLLFSVKALEPVYKEGWEDGRRGLYDDYKVMKETIEPFVKKVHDTAWHGDSYYYTRNDSNGTVSYAVPSS